MHTYKILTKKGTEIYITACDYFIDSFGVITFLNKAKNPIGVFNMQNIVGFKIEK